MDLIGCIDCRPVAVASGKGGGAAARGIRAVLPPAPAPSPGIGPLGRGSFVDYLPPDADAKSGPPPATVLAGIPEDTRLTGWRRSIAADRIERPAAAPTAGEF